MIDETKGFTLVRDFAATPEELWAAWTEPDQAAAWWHPHAVSTPRDTVTIDARPGGRYAYTMVNDETGERYPTGGEYREVVPFERLVFTWGSPDGDPDETPVVLLTFERLDGDRTRQTFELRGAEGHAGDAFMYDGWDQALANLAEQAERAA
jgi:uncharacterized protein YndB with AHSA1/START domain